MAHAEAWPGIKKHGLLSTSALLDLFEIKGSKRRAIESTRRDQSVSISHSRHGEAVIRDQKPMSDARLMKCLESTTPRQWYELLNSKVFFWVSKERLEKLLNARAYRREAQLVLTLDSEKVVEAYRNAIRLCPINSGATLYIPPLRSPATFQPINSFDYSYWRGRGRKEQDVVVECAINHSVVDIGRFLLKRELRPPR